MAYQLSQISPLDLNKSTGVGIKIPFESPTAFTTVYTTKDQLKYNLINYILTSRYERPFNPNFGLGLRSILFEQIYQENLEQIKANIISQIENNFPNIKISTIDIISDLDNSTITVKLSYIIINMNQSDNIIIAVQNA